MDDLRIYQAMSDEIVGEASKEVEAILDEVKQYEEEALNSLKENAKKDAELRLKQELDEMHLEAATEISALNSEQMKKLISKRDEYVKVIFDDVQRQLIEFTQSNDYLGFLEKKALEARDANFEEPIIYVRKGDLQFKDAIIKAYGQPVDVLESDKITLGGLIIEDQKSHLVLDETIEFALKAQKEWFNKNSGLVIR